MKAFGKTHRRDGCCDHSLKSKPWARLFQPSSRILTNPPLRSIYQKCPMVSARDTGLGRILANDLCHTTSPHIHGMQLLSGRPPSLPKGSIFSGTWATINRKQTVLWHIMLEPDEDHKSTCALACSQHAQTFHTCIYTYIYVYRGVCIHTQRVSARILIYTDAIQKTTTYLRFVLARHSGLQRASRGIPGRSHILPPRADGVPCTAFPNEAGYDPLGSKVDPIRSVHC